VQEAAVVAMPHPRWQERPFLIVVTAENAGVSLDELRAHLLNYVPKWWLPDGIEFVKELPHGPTGKLQKEELRRQVSEGTIVPKVFLRSWPAGRYGMQARRRAF
jgi:fatty-acyl-CoA synthase